MEIIQKRKLYKELSKPEYNSGSGFYTEDLGEEMSLVHESIWLVDARLSLRPCQIGYGQIYCNQY